MVNGNSTGNPLNNPLSGTTSGGGQPIDHRTQAYLQALVNSATYQLEQEILELTKRYEKEKNELDEKIKELSKDRANFVTLATIFIGFFTFISVEFQLLKTVNNIATLIGFTLILLACIIIFVLLVDYISYRWINQKNNFSNFHVFSIISVLVLLSLGGRFFHKGEKEQQRINIKTDTIENIIRYRLLELE